MSGAGSERRIVTVDGIDGSGKSVLARRLAAHLGPQAALLSIDDFRRPVDWTRTDRSELELYYDERYAFAEVDACLQLFLTGAPACSYRAFDGMREVLGETRALSLAGVSLLLVDGVFVARVPSAERALSIYVDVPAQEARRRLLTRDLDKGRTPEEITRRIDHRYFPAHARYHAERGARERAAVLVDNTDFRAPRLLRANIPQEPGWQPLRDALAAAIADRV
jgi:uridine kinase